MLISATVAEMPDLLTKRNYKKLLTDLQRIIREGKEDAERAAAQALIESYWSIGQLDEELYRLTRASAAAVQISGSPQGKATAGWVRCQTPGLRP